MGPCPFMMLWTAPPPAREAMDVGAVKAPTIQRNSLRQAVTTIGLDIAKSDSRSTELMPPARCTSAAS
jgi:hypothetical protein